MLHRPRPRLFAGIAAVLIALGTHATPAAAQTAPAFGPGPSAAPAPTGVEAYTVSGITVDVSATNANAARDQAIAEAQRRAWDELHKRVAPGGGPTPRLSDIELARLVQGFSIDEEKVSATRYVGTMTVRFRPNAVRDALGGTTASFVEPPTRPFVLLPLTMVGGRPVLWEDRTPWRLAWESHQTGTSMVQVVVPDGELDDIAAIGAPEAVAGNAEALSRIARKYNAGGVVVARTEVPAAGDVGRGLTVEVFRYDATGPKEPLTVPVRADAADRPEDLLARGPVQVIAALDEAWKRDNVVATGPEQTLAVSVPIGQLGDWLDVRKRLTGISGLLRYDTLSLSRYEAKVALVFRGDIPRLQEQLARRDMTLTRLPTPPQAAPVAVAPGQPLPVPAEVWQLNVQPPSAPVNPPPPLLPPGAQPPGPGGVPGIAPATRL